jgi:hypothetical protein
MGFWSFLARLLHSSSFHTPYLHVIPLNFYSIAASNRHVKELEGIQGSTGDILKGRLFISPPAKEVPVLKRGMPFNLTSEDGTKIVRCTTEMQFGAECNRLKMRCVAHCEEKSEIRNSFKRPNVSDFVCICCAD